MNKDEPKVFTITNRDLLYILLLASLYLTKTFTALDIDSFFVGTSSLFLFLGYFTISDSTMYLGPGGCAWFDIPTIGGTLKISS